MCLFGDSIWTTDNSNGTPGLVPGVRATPVVAVQGVAAHVEHNAGASGFRGVRLLPSSHPLWLILSLFFPKPG